MATQLGDTPWSLTGSDEGNYDDITNGGGLPEPQYPFEITVRKGQCVVGYITFEIPKSTHIVQARYAPSDAQGNPLTVYTWKVKG